GPGLCQASWLAILEAASPDDVIADAVAGLHRHLLQARIGDHGRRDNRRRQHHGRSGVARIPAVIAIAPTPANRVSRSRARQQCGGANRGRSEDSEGDLAKHLPSPSWWRGLAPVLRPAVWT